MCGTGGQVNDGWGRALEKGWLADKLWVDSPHVFALLVEKKGAKIKKEA